MSKGGYFSLHRFLGDLISVDVVQLLCWLLNYTPDYSTIFKSQY